ncbi:MAG TPA: hypothetical protein VNI84_08645 [Pyrinomonadaceae bacterium]|nr:hypothetical protein [Pyrinomonadaceae bacterium]
MKATSWFFRLSITFLTFLFGIGAYAIWYNSQTSVNTRQINLVPTQIELVPSANETDNSNNKLKTISCRKQLTGNVTVEVKRFVSKKGSNCYRYTVKNNTNQELRGIDIGAEKETDLAELVELPSGWIFAPDINGKPFVELRNSKSLVEPIACEEQNNIFISAKSFHLKAGKTGSFPVCMQSKWDSTYQTSHWIAYMFDGSDVAGKLINLDSE